MRNWSVMIYQYIPILLLLLGMSNGVYADILPVGTDLTIAIEARPMAAKKSQNYEKTWVTTCNTISKYFENRTGTIGRGSFSRISCLPKPTSLDKILKQPNKPSWVLMLSDTDARSGFEFFFIVGSKGLSQASQLMGPTNSFLADIKEPKYLKNICFYLLDQLPVFSLVTVKSETSSVTLDPQLDPEILPKEYILYTLRFDSKNQVWLPRAVGFAKPPEKKSAINNEWQVTLHKGVLSSNEPLFAHNSAGRGMLRKTFLDNLGSFFSKFGLQSLITGILSSLDSNLSGIRYGYPMLKSQDIISKSSMLSMFTEIRGGPLSGIRIYYDKTPLIKRTSSEQLVEHFGWSCLNLGWSFNIPVPLFASSVVHKFDFAPKIGVYNLDSLLAVTDESNVQQTANFTLKNAMNAGFETGVEHATKNLGLLRGWLAFNRSWGTQGATATRITSTKAGIDVYWNLLDIGKMKFKLLTFGSAESLRLSKDPPPADDESSVVAITDLSYNLVFLGAGATIAW